MRELSCSFRTRTAYPAVSNSIETLDISSLSAVTPSYNSQCGSWILLGSCQSVTADRKHDASLPKRDCTGGALLPQSAPRIPLITNPRDAVFETLEAEF